MNLTMDPREGIPVALTLCEGWLTRKVAASMVVAAFRAGSSGSMLSRAVLLAPPGLPGSGAPLTESTVHWLAVNPAEGASA